MYKKPTKIFKNPKKYIISFTVFLVPLFISFYLIRSAFFNAKQNKLSNVELILKITESIDNDFLLHEKSVKKYTENSEKINSVKTQEKNNENNSHDLCVFPTDKVKKIIERSTNKNYVLLINIFNSIYEKQRDLKSKKMLFKEVEFDDYGIKTLVSILSMIYLEENDIYSHENILLDLIYLKNLLNGCSVLQFVPSGDNCCNIMNK